MTPAGRFRRACRLGLLSVVALVGCAVPDFEFTSTTDAGPDGSSGAAGGGGTSGGGTGGGGTSATGGTSTGGSAGAAGGGGGTTQCGSHADCAATPSKPKCDPVGKSCVACLEAEDVCPGGFYCSSTSCKPGCKVGGSECTAPLACDATAHQCLGCTQDDDCPLGQICNLSTTGCVAGCTAQHACDSGKDCCSGSCKILALDPDHCGQCDKQCPVPPNGTRACEGGKCVVKCTVIGSADCNKDPSDGCEVDTKTDAANCGTCGKNCGGGQTCSNGSCSG